MCLPLPQEHVLQHADQFVQLMLHVKTEGDSLRYVCEYDSAVFSEFTAAGLTHLMDNLTGEFLTKELLGDICLTTKADEERILNTYDASSAYEDKPGYRHLQDSAGKYPDGF